MVSPSLKKIYQNPGNRPAIWPKEPNYVDIHYQRE